MKIRELIDQLQKLDPELPVIFINCGSGMADGEAEIKSVEEMETEDWFVDGAQYPYKKIKVARLLD